jgi:4-hydroxybenzoate polyprenyltransferase
MMVRETKIKKVLKSIWDEFVHGGHFFSLSATAVVGCVITLNSRYENMLPLLLVTYLIPQIIFNYDHLKDRKKDLLTNPERAKRLSKRYTLYLSLFFIYIFTFIVDLFFLPVSLTMLLAAILIFGVLYPKKLTNKIIGFKNLYSAFFFASIILFPYLYYSIKIDQVVLLIFMFVFLRGLVNTTFFDIKDIDGDRLENLKTLPVVFGKKRAIKYLKFLNLLSFIPLVVGLLLGFLPIYFVVLLLFFLYSLAYLKMGEKDFSSLRGVSYVMVDGEYYLWLLALIIIKKILVG